MGNKQKYVDEESKERDQESREGEDEQGEEVARRMGRRVKMSSDGQAEANERHESCDRVDDEDGGKSMSLGRGQREVGVLFVCKQFLCVQTSALSASW